jgi:hypothetical protein
MMKEGKRKRVNETWKAFLDAIIDDEIVWDAYYDPDTEHKFALALEIIHKAFKDNGIYKE